MLSRNEKQRASSKAQLTVPWELPPPAWAKLNTDGSVQCSRGSASAGRVLRGDDGRRTRAYTGSLGVPNRRVLDLEEWPLARRGQGCSCCGPVQ